MAVIWSRYNGARHYEVRTAGATRRLYTNGVLHSAWNPNRPLTGSVWDLLFLPALFYPRKRVRRVLILGAGAGALIHLLNRYVSPRSIVAIDNDPTHLYVARRFFGIDYPNTELIHDDAIKWVQGYRGPAFDMVVEDLFFEFDGEPVRLMHNDVRWLNGLGRLTSAWGMLVINNGDSSEARFSLANAGRYATAFRFSLPALQNRVLALLMRPADKPTLTGEMKRLGLDRAGVEFACRAV